MANETSAPSYQEALKVRSTEALALLNEVGLLESVHNAMKEIRGLHEQTRSTFDLLLVDARTLELDGNVSVVDGKDVMHGRSATGKEWTLTNMSLPYSTYNTHFMVSRNDGAGLEFNVREDEVTDDIHFDVHIVGRPESNVNETISYVVAPRTQEASQTEVAESQ